MNTPLAEVRWVSTRMIAPPRHQKRRTADEYVAWIMTQTPKDRQKIIQILQRYVDRRAS